MKPKRATKDEYNESYYNLEVPEELNEKCIVNKVRVVLEGLCDSCMKR